MTRRRSLFRGALGALLGICVAACDDPPADSRVEAVQQQLVGTWLREYDEQGAHVRRVLVLEADGTFREMSTVAVVGTPDKHAAQGSGQWTFDGTNLKRRYVLVNGKPVAAPALPFATFELRFPGKREFVGLDHVRKREVRYERVADGTQP